MSDCTPVISSLNRISMGCVNSTEHVQTNKIAVTKDSEIGGEGIPQVTEEMRKKLAEREAEAKEKLMETEFQAKLIDSLSISEDEAELLVEAGMKSFDEIAYAEESSLKTLLEVNDKKIEELKTAASDAALIEAMGEFSAEEDELASLSDLGLSTEDINILKTNKVKNKDDIAELSVDELKELISIEDKKAADVIMKAREDWFK